MKITAPLDSSLLGSFFPYSLSQLLRQAWRLKFKFFYIAAVFRLRLRQSAIIAINSELVGFPFMFETV